MFFYYAITIYLSKQTSRYDPIIGKCKRDEDQEEDYEDCIPLTRYDNNERDDRYNNIVVVCDKCLESEVV